MLKPEWFARLQIATHVSYLLLPHVHELSINTFNQVFTGTVTELLLHTVSLFYLYVTPFDKNILQLVLVSYINNLDYCVTTTNYQLPSFVLSFVNLDVEVDFINTRTSLNLARKLISCKFSIFDDTCPTCTFCTKKLVMARNHWIVIWIFIFR